MQTPNGWTEWSKHVLFELERLNTCYERLDQKIDQVNIELVKLKVKSGIWGLVGGAIPICIMLGIYFITKGPGG